MKARLMGLPSEVTQAMALIREAFDVVSESDPYPCRGRSREVRVYVEVCIGGTGEPEGEL